MHSVMVCWKARFKAGRKEESERDRQTEREREGGRERERERCNVSYSTLAILFCGF